MAKTIDVYKEWLRIDVPTRPLNHYQLLRLKKFEDDAVKVREHYRKLNAHVRKFAAGDFAVQSQELLNELAKAMLCLTDARRKGEYDASLGRTDDSGGRRRTFEEILVGRQVIDPEQLAKARNYANAVGVDIRDALVQQKLARPEAVMPAYAESVGLPFVELSEMQIDESLIRRVPALIARQHSCAPVMIDDDQLLMASPNQLDPNVEEELRLRTGMSVRSVLCTPASINELINKYYTREAVAAEMAAGPQTRQRAPAGKQADGVAALPPAAKAKPAKPPKAAREPSSPEAKKERIMIAFMSFNFAFMVVMLGYGFWYNWQFGLPAFAMAFLVGAIGGGIGWVLGPSFAS